MLFSSQAAQRYCFCCSILGISVSCWSRKVLSTLQWSWNWLETGGRQWDFQAHVQAELWHKTPFFMLFSPLAFSGKFHLFFFPYCTTSSAPFLPIYEPSWLQSFGLLLVRLAALCPYSSLGQTFFLPLHLQSPHAPDGRSSKWGYLEGITDPLEMEKNWTAGFGTASSTCGLSVLAGCVFVLLLPWDSARWQEWEDVSFMELLQSKGLAGLKWLQKLFLLREFYTWEWERPELLHCEERSLSIFSEETKWAKWEKSEGRSIKLTLGIFHF